MQPTPPTGRRAVIVANGSSVDAMPPAFWRACRGPDTMLIGTNRALCFQSLQPAAFDALVIRDTYRNLWHDQAVGIRYHEELWKPAACWKVGPAHARYTQCDEFVRFVDEWQHERILDANREAAVMRQSSVVLMAANWAWLQGAREIFLVGVDYHGRHAAMTAPYKKSTGWEGLYDKPVPDAIERQFSLAVRAVDSLAGKILNLSPGTRLRAVPAADWKRAVTTADSSARPRSKPRPLRPTMSNRRLRALLIVHNRQWRNPAEPYQHLAAGLKRLGHQVDVVVPGRWPVCGHTPDVVFLWNGAKGTRAELAAKFRENDCPVLVMERGFFDRENHTQIDWRGFGHNASWAERLKEPAPADGTDRFRQVWGRSPADMRRPNRDRYVLVLLQVPGDAQLRDADIRHPGPLVEAVEDAAPVGMEVRVRAHPLFPWPCGNARRARTIGGSLEEALRPAAFAVTINSNSGNEALALGCPVLCLGPSLYAIADVAVKVPLVELSAAMEQMAGGLAIPRDGEVRNYLYHLACRQWSCPELAEGTVLEELLRGAVDADTTTRQSPTGRA